MPAEPSRVILVREPADAVEQLLLSAARGDHEALAVLHRRMAGLVDLNVRRVLGNATRSEAVTEQIFADLPRIAVDFDPTRTTARLWLLELAHQRAIDELGSADTMQMASP